MSTEVEEKTVSTETPKGHDAFAAARASIAAQSTDQGSTEEPTPTPDDTPATTPTQEPEKPADESPDAGPATEDALLSKDELAALPPKQRAQAEKWQAKLTQRAQRLSAQEKEFQQWKPLVDGFGSDPDATFKQIAEQMGYSVSKPSQDTIVKADTAQAVTDAIDTLPAELRTLFQPFAEALGKQLEAKFEGRLKPVADQQSQMISEAAAAETDGQVKAFEAKHADFKTHEPAMLSWMQKFLPQSGVSTDEYMEAAYQAVTANLKKVEQVKATVKKINASVESMEPNTPGIPEGRIEQTRPANWNQLTQHEQFVAAREAAKAGILWK